MFVAVAYDVFFFVWRDSSDRKGRGRRPVHNKLYVYIPIGYSCVVAITASSLQTG